ncbi:hypothetical protein ACM66B_004867 [Microbotryomycetes sp. NB124-2]
MRHVRLLLFALFATVARTQLLPAATNRPEQQKPNEISAVCTPTACVQGTHSISAAVRVTYSLNSTLHDLVLLPGTYIPSRLNKQFTSTNSTTNFPTLPTSSSANSSDLKMFASQGFSFTGSLMGSSFTVSMMDGVTVYEAAPYAGTASHIDVTTTANATTTAESAFDDRSRPASLLLSDNNVYVLATAPKDGRRIVIWDSVADFRDVKDGAQIKLVEVQNCLSCDSTSSLSNGACVPTEDGCSIVPSFGVCLATLVTANPSSPSLIDDEPAQKKLLPWWSIVLLVIILISLVLGTTFFCLRRKFRHRRNLKTQQFANSLDKKQVAINLERMNPRIERTDDDSIRKSPPDISIHVPTYHDLVESTSHASTTTRKGDNLTVLESKFVISNSPTESESTRWSRSSFGSVIRPTIRRKEPEDGVARTIESQQTGSTIKSGWTSASGKRVEWASNNPFVRS